MSVDPQAQALQTAAEALIVNFQGLCRAVGLYDPNNAAVLHYVTAIQGVLQALSAAGVDSIKLQLLAEESFVNGKLLKMDAALYDRATNLAALLGRFDIGEIALDVNVDEASFGAFVADLSESVRSGESKLRGEAYGGMGLRKAAGNSIASFRFEPDRLAVWLYSSLLDLVERLYAEYEAGRAPSLLPVKRTIQLVIDSMKNYGGIYQVLTLVHPPGTTPSVPTQRAAMAIDIIGFGIFLGLPNTDLMILALSIVLGGLSGSDEPEEAVRPLFRFAGLGDTAMGLTLALYDSRALRRGQSGGVPGRMIAAVEAYHTLLLPGDDRPPQAPPAAIQAMLKNKVEGVSAGLARVFFAYKGPWPLGTLLQLKTGQKVLVIAQPDHPDGKDRPIIAQVGPDGKLGDRVPMIQHPELQIAAAPRPSEVGFDITMT